MSQDGSNPMQNTDPQAGQAQPATQNPQPPADPLGAGASSGNQAGTSSQTDGSAQIPQASQASQADQTLQTSQSGGGLPDQNFAPQQGTQAPPGGGQSDQTMGSQPTQPPAGQSGSYQNQQTQSAGGYPPVPPYPPQGGYSPAPQFPPQGGYAPQGAYQPGQPYPPQGGYPPAPPYPPQGGYPTYGGYPPAGGMPPAGGFGGSQQDDTTPANFQLGTKFPPVLKVKIPAHDLKFDENYFIRLLAGSISLAKDEKKKIIESVPKLKQTQIDELIRIFEEEKQKFAALSQKHVSQLEKLAQQHYEEWMDLESEYELGEKKKEEENRADEIRKNLGI